MGVLKELIFFQFILWVAVVVLKELIFNSFYFGRVVVLKELILTANPAEWINLVNFKKLSHSSSINFTCQKINNEYSCNFTYI